MYFRTIYLLYDDLRLLDICMTILCMLYVCVHFNSCRGVSMLQIGESVLTLLVPYMLKLEAVMVGLQILRC